ncbi:hypothetical protein [Streptomyces sp. PU_AKi4]|uniref:hypothetical protein n=1 Tax=Streptomyces sp. PU_AKi4 TaxID=2800809 RepID=UPI003526418F
MDNWIPELLAPSALVMSGKAGTYMSVASGATAVSEANTVISSPVRRGAAEGVCAVDGLAMDVEEGEVKGCDLALSTESVLPTGNRPPRRSGRQWRMP